MTGIKYYFGTKECSLFTKLNTNIPFYIETVFYELEKKDHELLVGKIKDYVYFKNYKL